MCNRCVTDITADVQVFGPLMLMVQKMTIDLARWVVIAIVPVAGFAFCLHVLYKDQYKYDTAATFDDDCAQVA